MNNFTGADKDDIEFIEIASIVDIPPGERIYIEVDGKPIVVINIGGQVFAVGDVCTHDNGPLGDGELDDHELICPRHGARFDIKTGKTMVLPAVVDIPSYPLRVDHGKIFLGIPKGK